MNSVYPSPPVGEIELVFRRSYLYVEMHILNMGLWSHFADFGEEILCWQEEATKEKKLETEKSW